MARYINTSKLSKADIKRLKKNGEEIPFKLCAITSKDKRGNRTVFDMEFLLDELNKKGIKEIQGMGSQVVDAKDWLFRISRNSGKESNYMNLLFFQTWFDGRLHANDSVDHWLYKNISIKTLRRYIPYSKGQLNIIINILLAAEVIEILEREDEETGRIIQIYKDGRFSRGWRIHPRWKSHAIGSEWKAFEHYDTRGVIASSKWLDADEENLVPPKGLDDLHNQWVENLLKIDLQKDALEVYRRAFDDEQDHAHKVNLFHKSKIFRKGTIEKILAFANIDLRTWPSLKVHGNLKCRWNEATGRVYHSFVGYPNKVGPKIENEPERRFSMRKLLSYKGYPILQIDVRSAHAFLLVKLYDLAEEYLDDIWGGLFGAATDPDKARKAQLKGLKAERRKYVALFSCKKDFYVTLAKLSGIKKPDEESKEDFRDRMKGDFWPFLYGAAKDAPDFEGCSFSKFYSGEFGRLFATINYLKSNWWMGENGPERKRIRAKFPKDKRDREKDNAELKLLGAKLKPEINTIHDLKYRQLAYFSQQLESKIMIDGVCKRLAEWAKEKNKKSKDPKKDIWHIPLHDAIWTQQQSRLAVRRVMKEEWKKVLGDAPHLENTVYD